MKKEPDFVEQVMRGRSPTMSLETALGRFVVKTTITAWDRVKIERGVALRCGDAPISAYEKETVNFFRALATLAVVIEEAPEGWTGPDDCPDAELITELYRGYLRLFRENESKARELGRGTEEGKLQDKKSSVGDGAFSGIAHGPAGS